MTLPRPTIVIFDMDGTTVRHINPRFLHALEFLDDWCFRISKILAWMSRKDKRMPFITPADLLKRGAKRRILIVHRVIHKVRRKPVEQLVAPAPGIYDVLNLLRSHDIPVGLASNSLGKGYGHDILEKFDLAHYFRATIFREDIEKSKPSPESIFKTLSAMQVAPGPQDVIWYIGDRHKDITAAIAAGASLPAKTVAIACGVNAAIAVIEKHLGPDHIIMSYYDMYNRLLNLLGKPV